MVNEYSNFELLHNEVDITSLHTGEGEGDVNYIINANCIEFIILEFKHGNSNCFSTVTIVKPGSIEREYCTHYIKLASVGTSGYGKVVFGQRYISVSNSEYDDIKAISFSDVTGYAAGGTEDNEIYKQSSGIIQPYRAHIYYRKNEKYSETVNGGVHTPTITSALG